MPFVGSTPESRLAQNQDSKGSSRTCRGVTSSGKPCRRPVSPPGTPSSSRNKLSAAEIAAAESGYCWQHRDQAAQASPPKHSNRPQARPDHAGPRTSIDTLTDRLNLVNLEEKRPSYNKYSNGGHNSSSRPPQQYSPQEHRKPPSFSFCCFKLSLDDDLLEPRPRPSSQQYHNQSPPGSAMSQYSASRPSAGLPSQVQAGNGRRRRQSLTSTYMKLIPSSLDPTTASVLMKELAKGFTEAEEPGYIYMFWLTPENDPRPSRDAARSLMEASSSSKPPSANRKKPLLLKIGRAANVQRRMNEWSRQCGHDVELLRYYPYIPSGSTSTPRQTPHVKKVERLIHLELTGMGMRADLGKCEACGKEHKEWFTVEQSRDGVAEVDEIIRRWVDWDEGLR
ncbi:hypothetical protein TD95_004412 [Thielaviopsis punctulata]|uniref:Bacteriophage T5 Orf172 DNA-binding domain-containing protein n=1 Tax=Thielaviopsis punctulata TaxID=72032 RepID=A0A0F4ZCW2_9PEZI|nr:hypothetical protein TD95_004412 [Thielaviopsis punctulata]